MTVPFSADQFLLHICLVLHQDRCMIESEVMFTRCYTTNAVTSMELSSLERRGNSVDRQDACLRLTA